ncbi:hypothetical protein ACHAWF_009120, partial [Thalassiosira exigua]
LRANRLFSPYRDHIESTRWSLLESSSQQGAGGTASKAFSLQNGNVLLPFFAVILWSLGKSSQDKKWGGLKKGKARKRTDGTSRRGSTVHRTAFAILSLMGLSSSSLHFASASGALRSQVDGDHGREEMLVEYEPALPSVGEGESDEVESISGVATNSNSSLTFGGDLSSSHRRRKLWEVTKKVLLCDKCKETWGNPYNIGDLTFHDPNVRNGKVWSQRNTLARNTEIMIQDTWSFPLYCLDVDRDGDNFDNTIRPRKCEENNSNQKFTFTTAGQIKNGGRCWMHNDNGFITMGSCDGDRAMWTYDTTTEQLRNKYYDNSWCLDSFGGYEENDGLPRTSTEYPSSYRFFRYQRDYRKGASYLLMRKCDSSRPSQKFFQFHPASSNPQKPNKGNLNILHLGDSYSAGNGNPWFHKTGTWFSTEDFDFYMPINSANWEGYGNYLGCFRHREQWGNQIADKLRAEGYTVQYTNRACSGARAQGIVGDQQIDAGLAEFFMAYWTFGDDYSDASFDKSMNGDTYMYRSSDAWGGIETQMWVRPQKMHVTKSVDVVLLTMGGNDVGFSDIIKACFINPTGTNCNDEVDKAKKDISGDVRTLLKNTLGEMKKRMRDDAVIIWATYPLLALRCEDQTVLKTSDCLGYIKLVRQVGEKATEVMRAIVEEVNQNESGPRVYLYEDTHKVFDGHEAEVTGYNKNPIGYLNEPNGVYDVLESLKVSEQPFKMMLYHPRPEGHFAWANSMYDFVKSRLPRPASLESDSAAMRDNQLDYDGLEVVQVDIAVVFDESPPMENTLAIVRANLEAWLEELMQPGNAQYRVAIVAFDCDDIHTRIIEDFSNNIEEIVTAAQRELGFRIDSQDDSCPNRLLSGMEKALTGLMWPEDNIASAVIAVTNRDLAHPDDEGVSWHDIRNWAYAHDTALNFIFVGDDVEQEVPYLMPEISADTGGQVYSVDADGGVFETLRQVTMQLNNGMCAHLDESGDAVIGVPHQFISHAQADAGQEIIKWHWSFRDDEDGHPSYNVVSDEPSVFYTYDEDYEGFIHLKVEDADGVHSQPASQQIRVDKTGDVPGDDDDSEKSGKSSSSETQASVPSTPPDARRDRGAVPRSPTVPASLDRIHSPLLCSTPRHAAWGWGRRSFDREDLCRPAGSAKEARKRREGRPPPRRRLSGQSSGAIPAGCSTGSQAKRAHPATAPHVISAGSSVDYVLLGTLLLRLGLLAIELLLQRPLDRITQKNVLLGTLLLRLGHLAPQIVPRDRRARSASWYRYGGGGQGRYLRRRLRHAALKVPPRSLRETAPLSPSDDGGFGSPRAGRSLRG